MKYYQRAMMYAHELHMIGIYDGKYLADVSYSELDPSERSKLYTEACRYIQQRKRPFLYKRPVTYRRYIHGKGYQWVEEELPIYAPMIQS